MGSYSNDVFPEPLSNEEEMTCILKMKQGDKEARNKLIEHNLRLVAHIVKKFESNGQDVDDLIADIYNEPHKEESLENPTMAMAEKSPLSEPSLENKKSLEEGTKTDKPSVRKELQKIKENQNKNYSQKLSI